MNEHRMKICEKKTKLAQMKLSKVLHKIDSLKLNNYFISRLDTPGGKSKFSFKLFLTRKYLIAAIGALVLGCWWVYSESLITGCLLQLPSDSKSLFRAPEDCSMCAGVRGVARLANTSAEQFELDFAYSARPVIVTDATRHWKAVEQFNFKFFANFYQNTKMGKRINECFYFSYKSGLNSLDEVFSMDEERANLTGEPWYVGWSTCYEEEARALRRHYARPYFLPRAAESDAVDWIFMGGPGPGAPMHVDSVRHVSWQAQLRGRKRWQLAPPAECLYACSWLAFTVEPGDILVVDTNRWYHQTQVLPGDISITIGAEYD